MRTGGKSRTFRKGGSFADRDDRRRRSTRISLPTPDYDAADVLVVREPEQLRALGDDLRSRIVILLREHAHSTTELADKLGLPKGTVGHHVKVLEKAGLVRVVRTRQVRAVTERYYGRTARLFLFESTDADGEDVRNVIAASLRRAAEEMLPPDDDDTDELRRPPRSPHPRRREAASRAGSRSSRTSSATPTRPTASRTGSHSRSTGARPMRRLRRPTGGLWEHADFLKLWTGQSISELGSQISQLAIPIVAAIALHASPIVFSLLGVFGFLPFILFALPAGAWVDRMRRRRILIAGDAARALLLATIPVTYALGALTIGQLLVIQFVVGIFTVFFDVAYQSYLPQLVHRDHLIEGNSKLQLTVSVAQVAGPSAAGGLIAAITAPYAIVADAISFVVSTVFLLRIRKVETLPERAEGEPKPRMWPEVKEGINWIVRNPYLRRIAATTGLSNFFGSMGFAIFVLYALRVLHLHAVGDRTRLRRRLGRRDHRRARRQPHPEKARRRPHDHRDGDALLARVHPRSVRTAVVPAAGADRRVLRHAVRRRRLQHHADQPAPGDHARAPPGPHERGDALDRLGNDPDRNARRRRARDGVHAAHDALRGRDPRRADVPLRALLAAPRHATRCRSRSRSRRSRRRSSTAASSSPHR